MYGNIRDTQYFTAMRMLPIKKIITSAGAQERSLRGCVYEKAHAFKGHVCCSSISVGRRQSLKLVIRKSKILRLTCTQRKVEQQLAPAAKLTSFNCLKSALSATRNHDTRLEYGSNLPWNTEWEANFRSSDCVLDWLTMSPLSLVYITPNALSTTPKDYVYTSQHGNDENYNIHAFHQNHGSALAIIFS